MHTTCIESAYILSYCGQTNQCSSLALLPKYMQTKCVCNNCVVQIITFLFCVLNEGKHRTSRCMMVYNTDGIAMDHNTHIHTQSCMCTHTHTHTHTQHTHTHMIMHVHTQQLMYTKAVHALYLLVQFHMHEGMRVYTTVMTSIKSKKTRRYPWVGVRVGMGETIPT